MDKKDLINEAYHAVVVTGLAVAYAKVGQMLTKGPLPKLDFTPRDIGMAAIDVASAMATKDFLVKQGIIPADISK